MLFEGLFVYGQSPLDGKLCEGRAVLVLLTDICPMSQAQGRHSVNIHCLDECKK